MEKQKLIEACAVPIAKCHSEPVAFTINEVIDCIMEEYAKQSTDGINQFEKGYSQGLEHGKQSTDEAQEWISVEDRLPKPESHVIIYGPKIGRTRSRYSTRNFAYGFDEELGFWKSTSKQYVKGSVTHWITLLKPPKAGIEK